MQQEHSLSCLWHGGSHNGVDEAGASPQLVNVPV